MVNEAVILCGGVPSPDWFPARKEPLRLNLWGRGQNVKLKIEDIHRPLIVNIPEVLLDLLDIATYVYVADQAVSRGTDNVRDIGAKWRRKLTFCIPVRQLDIWSKPTVQQILTETLDFLSDDAYTFEFQRDDHLPKPDPYFDFIEGGTTFLEADGVILFSGGLDSLAGAIQETLVDNQRPVLVTHRSTPKLDSPTRSLLEAFYTKCTSVQPIHIPVWIYKDSSLAKDFTQRTRSFLYGSLAVTVARLFRLSRIKFYENGITSFKLPISPQLVGARASRSTHPKSMAGFARLFSEILDEPFSLETPFIWKTKTDIVAMIGENDCQDLIAQTRSCHHTIRSTRQQPHCGKCSQCIERRFATLASGYSNYDLGEYYVTDLLMGEREKGVDRTMVESYVRTAREIEEMPDEEFFQRFPEATRTFDYLNFRTNEAATRIISLYRRHAEQMGKVIDDGIRRYASDFRKGRLPESCLIVASMPDEYKTQLIQEEVVAQPTFRRDGETWTAAFAGKTRHLKHLKGHEYIAILLGRPHEEIHCQVLHDAVTNIRVTVSTSTSQKKAREAQLVADGFRIKEKGRSFDSIDSQTREECRARLLQLRRERLEAEENHDETRLEAINGETARIERYLGGSVDAKGRPRQVGDAEDRARKNVFAAIKFSLEHIIKCHPELGQHLENSIQTGTYLSYTPETPINWIL